MEERNHLYLVHSNTTCTFAPTGTGTSATGRSSYIVTPEPPESHQSHQSHHKEEQPESHQSHAEAEQPTPTHTKPQPELVTQEQPKPTHTKPLVTRESLSGVMPPGVELREDSRARRPESTTKPLDFSRGVLNTKFDLSMAKQLQKGIGSMGDAASFIFAPQMLSAVQHKREEQLHLLRQQRLEQLLARQQAEMLARKVSYPPSPLFPHTRPSTQPQHPTQQQPSQLHSTQPLPLLQEEPDAPLPRLHRLSSSINGHPLMQPLTDEQLIQQQQQIAQQQWQQQFLEQQRQLFKQKQMQRHTQQLEQQVPLMQQLEQQQHLHQAQLKQYHRQHSTPEQDGEAGRSRRRRRHHHRHKHRGQQQEGTDDPHHLHHHHHHHDKEPSEDPPQLLLPPINQKPLFF